MKPFQVCIVYIQLLTDVPNISQLTDWFPVTNPVFLSQVILPRNIWLLSGYQGNRARNSTKGQILMKKGK